MTASKATSLGSIALAMVLRMEAGWLWLITVLMPAELRDRHREERASHLLDHVHDDQVSGHGPFHTAYNILLRFLAGMSADVAACVRHFRLPSDGQDRRAIVGALRDPAEKMGKKTPVAALYVVSIVAVVVGADFLFLRNGLGARLIANVGIVLVFVVFWLKVLKRPPWRRA